MHKRKIKYIYIKKIRIVNKLHDLTHPEFVFMVPVIMLIAPDLWKSVSYFLKSYTKILLIIFNSTVVKLSRGCLMEKPGDLI